MTQEGNVEQLNVTLTGDAASYEAMVRRASAEAGLLQNAIEKSNTIQGHSELQLHSIMARRGPVMLAMRSIMQAAGIGGGAEMMHITHLVQGFGAIGMAAGAIMLTAKAIENARERAKELREAQTKWNEELRESAHWWAKVGELQTTAFGGQLRSRIEELQKKNDEVRQKDAELGRAADYNPAMRARWGMFFERQKEIVQLKELAEKEEELARVRAEAESLARVRTAVAAGVAAEYGGPAGEHATLMARQEAEDNKAREDHAVKMGVLQTALNQVTQTYNALMKKSEAAGGYENLSVPDQTTLTEAGANMRKFQKEKETTEATYANEARNRDNTHAAQIREDTTKQHALVLTQREKEKEADIRATTTGYAQKVALLNAANDEAMRLAKLQWAGTAYGDAYVESLAREQKAKTAAVERDHRQELEKTQRGLAAQLREAQTHGYESEQVKKQAEWEEYRLNLMEKLGFTAGAAAAEVKKLQDIFAAQGAKAFEENIRNLQDAIEVAHRSMSKLEVEIAKFHRTSTQTPKQQEETERLMRAKDTADFAKAEKDKLDVYGQYAEYHNRLVDAVTAHELTSQQATVLARRELNHLLGADAPGHVIQLSSRWEDIQNKLAAGGDWPKITAEESKRAADGIEKMNQGVALRMGGSN